MISPPKPIKVLHILHSLGMGGAETWLMELLRYWAHTDAVQMHFLATGGVRGVFDSEVEELGGKVHYLRYGRDNLVTFISKFRQILKSEQYDAIHDHGAYASGLNFLMGTGRLPPVRITHFHTALLHLKANYAVTPMRRIAASVGRRLVLRLATHICGTSAQCLHDHGLQPQPGPPSVSVLHCGIKMDRFAGPRQADRRSVLEEFGFSDDARVVLFAGRLDRNLEIGHPRNSKNSWLAVLIAKAAVERDPRVRLLMAGAGLEERAKLEHRIEQWGLSNQLRLLGVREDMGRLMRAADTLLFPSVEEGLGMVAIEAQAAGTPVLASDAIPQEAVLSPAIFRKLSVGAPPAIWADALLELVEAPRLQEPSLSQMIKSNPFSISESANRLENIYRSRPANRRVRRGA